MIIAKKRHFLLEMLLKKLYFVMNARMAYFKPMPILTQPYGGTNEITVHNSFLYVADFTLSWL